MDPLTLVMLAVLAALVFFMFRNSRKRQKDLAALQAQMVVGAEVMTNFGMYGTILAIDEEANKVALEIAPGTVVQLHRQTIARVVEPIVAEPEDEGVAELNQGSATVMGEPDFGQRVADTDEEPKKGDA
ncbi:preprotein translocase subunit YajC [Cryobacterium sp. TMT1-62]|uniref:preprotein translocase subunit YajC n=2 Tax=unclassified Cryobacterium TaxID=2649013 RepID=UPI000CE53D20|nr:MULTISPECIES: preprotein translocase subunit YajC [unclassified Cryobacterium]TFC39404.1 preprotein translocase subunit YajC [Cryobacterium sp. TMT2-14]TFC61547.1 preprotein translocase subunit YajC [Cryobacterium sp. TMT2-18-3]TFC29203.1 preprotein translocase subunit YajC [Cryobacterium sp. TMT2-18-2]TFC39578.1 preprotein translocase subunit YajC [Cryobacterium sp. TMT2-42-4]TFC70787.1 preprotein translocase subunit YajC [Cryobacterium sp. TMT2-4]